MAEVTIIPEKVELSFDMDEIKKLNMALICALTRLNDGSKCRSHHNTGVADFCTNLKEVINSNQYLGAILK